ncbi:MAG: OmpH family outer membrane protein [Nitrospinae bacterium]|nr:OmpH family outer membrane protein [Nitrospinota bacterium]
MRYKLTRSMARFFSFLSIIAVVVSLTISVAAAENSKVGFIDVQKAISSTKSWKKDFAGFKIDFKKQRTVITQKENKIKKMLEDLNKQSFILDPKLKKKKEDQFRKEKVAFERYVEDQNKEFAIKEKEMTREFLKQMIDVIQKIGKERKYTMILEKKSVLYHNTGNDLTALAIKTYDRTHK